MSEKLNSPEVLLRNQWLATIFALFLPTLVTLVYFRWAADYDSGIQQTVYTLAKCVQFLFPAIWVFAFPFGRSAWSNQPRGVRKGLLLGGAFGLVVLLGALGLYYGLIRALPIFQEPAMRISQKVAAMGMDTQGRFLAMALFYSGLHSLLEEYYWRWFVFRQLNQLLNLPSAIFLSSLGFMAHHLLVLTTFFGWDSPLSWLLSLSVAVGGAFWAWLYHRTQSLWGPWLSHAIVDTAIFLIGYDLVF